MLLSFTIASKHNSDCGWKESHLCSCNCFSVVKIIPFICGNLLQVESFSLAFIEASLSVLFISDADNTEQFIEILNVSSQGNKISTSL